MSHETPAQGASRIVREVLEWHADGPPGPLRDHAIAELEARRRDELAAAWADLLAEYGRMLCAAFDDLVDAIRPTIDSAVELYGTVAHLLEDPDE